MKRLLKMLMLGLAGGLGFGVFNGRADLEVGASITIHAKADFDAPLATYGKWVEVGSYGRCWRPLHVSVGWEPYCQGHWVWTDCGWYWESDEPWAWACYHYGHWVYDDDYGWVWVPDVVWGPAWVSWRVGGGYLGWAPLPPPGFFFAHVAAPRFFVFVKAGRFTEPIRASLVVRNDPAIIKETTSINHIQRVDRAIAGTRRRVVVNDGPGVQLVDKAMHKSIAALPIREVVARTRLPGPPGRELELRDQHATPHPDRRAPGAENSNRRGDHATDGRHPHGPPSDTPRGEHGSRSDRDRGDHGRH